jgi:hypothetical protein
MICSLYWSGAENILGNSGLKFLRISLIKGESVICAVAADTVMKKTIRRFSIKYSRN